MTATETRPVAATEDGGDLADVRRPWRPAAVPPEDVPDESLRDLSYVVVDENVGVLTTLGVSPWPAADGYGRLRFDVPADRGHVVVHHAELHDTLYAGWLSREPRVGDAFAVRIAPAVEARLAAGDDVSLDAELRLADVFVGEVYDVSAEARTVAKLAYYAAMAPVVTEAEAVTRRQADKVLRPKASPKPHHVRARPWRGPVVPAATPAVEPPGRLPAALLRPAAPGEFVREVTQEPDALVYFLLNVGDGDTQVLLLPADRENRTRRRALIVDVATSTKLLRLLDSLTEAELLLDPEANQDVFPVVVATHPHEDHIGGMPQFLERFGRAGRIGDFWEPGYYHPSATFVETMTLLEDCSIMRTQPTSGMTRWVGDVKITVLAPSVSLRVRYDSYGVEVNDSSIVLKVDFPAARIAQQLGEQRHEGNRGYLRLDSPWTLVLGADAQTTSWAHVTADFPQLHRQYDTPLYRELAAARGRDHLSAQVLKVSHHASKHGINLELVERIHAEVALVSSVCGGGKYNFPHLLATEAIREAMQRTTSKNTARLPDHRLGIHYTGASVREGNGSRDVGSIALVFSPQRRSKMRMWRFGDRPGQPLDLDRGERLAPVRSPR
ncbi:ComEC/Rec2 family competence protein [Geodermatophilus sp. SYSU D00710]